MITMKSCGRLLDKVCFGLVFMCILLSGRGHAENFYVNDGMDGSEVWCTAAWDNATGVPGDASKPFASIQYVIDTYPLGGNSINTVFVDQGSYSESVVITTLDQPNVGKLLTFKGAGPALTSLNAGGSSGFQINNADRVKITGFEIRNFSIGVYFTNQAMNDTVSNCVIHNGTRVGIALNNSGQNNILDCEVYDINQVTIGGEAISIWGGSAGVLVDSCYLHDNTGGPAIYMDGVNHVVQFTVCAGANNSPSVEGAGILVNGSSPEIRDCTFYNNSGPGILSGWGANPVVRNCIAAKNGTYGFQSTNASMTVTYSLTWNNSTGDFYDCSGTTGNLTNTDPVFISETSGNANYLHLDCTASPAFDAGDPSDSPYYCDYIDIGAYEATNSFCCNCPAVTISGISPSVACPGDTLTISGSGFGDTQGAGFVTFSNGIQALTYSSWSDNQIEVVVPDGAGSGVLSVTNDCLVGDYSDTSLTVYSVLVTNVFPSSGCIGNTISIAGSGFMPVQGTGKVYIGGTEVGIYNSWSDISISVDVPAGAVTGPVTVSNDCPNGMSTVSEFTVSVLSLAGFTPIRGCEGTEVSITGTGFGSLQGTGEVYFNGTVAGGYTLWSETELRAIVPVGALSGPISISNDCGIGAIFSSNFTVLRVQVDSVNPLTGCAGDTVVIGGSGFDSPQGAGVVRFGGVVAVTYNAWSNTGISVVVPTGALTGPVDVINNCGSSNRYGIDFTVPPVLPEVQKTADSSFAALGDVITYKILVRNPSLCAADNLLVSDLIPVGTAYVNGSLKFGATNSTYASAAALTDTADDDEGWTDSTTVEFSGTGSGVPSTLASLAGQSGQAFYFQVTVNTNTNSSGGGGGGSALYTNVSFYDDFETGNLSKWDNGAGGATADNSAPISGTYSARVEDGQNLDLVLDNTGWSNSTLSFWWKQTADDAGDTFSLLVDSLADFSTATTLDSLGGSQPAQSNFIVLPAWTDNSAAVYIRFVCQKVGGPPDPLEIGFVDNFQVTGVSNSTAASSGPEPVGPGVTNTVTLSGTDFLDVFSTNIVVVDFGSDISVVRQVTNVLLNGLPSLNIPGATLYVETVWTNKGTDGIAGIIIESLGTNVDFVAGSEGQDGTWTLEYSTVSDPIKTWNSPDFSTVLPPTQDILWIRWKKGSVLAGEKGQFTYRCIIR